MSIPPDTCDIIRSTVRMRVWRYARFTLLVTVLMALHSAVLRADIDDDYNLALQFYKQDRWDAAADKLQSFLDNAPADHPKVPLAKLYLGQALVHERKFDQARPHFRDFVKNYPQQEDVPLAMYRAAECSYFLDDYTAAQRELNAFLRKVTGDNPLAEWALLYLGETELQLKHPDAARQAFEQGLKQFEQGRLSEELQFGLARAYDQLEESAKASQIYQQIVQKGGRRAVDAQFNLAAALFERQQYESAAELFESIPQKFGDHKSAPLAQLNAGYCYYHLGKFPEALAQFEKVRNDPKLGPTAAYWTGLSQKSLEDWDVAAKTLLDQFAKDENQPLAESLLFHAADARLGAKNYAEAGRLFRDLYRRWPQGELADDSLHLATEAAILAGDYEVAKELDAQFNRQFRGSGLRMTQDLLTGRMLLAEGDRLARDDQQEPARERYRKAVETFTRVVDQSTLDETKSLARLQLARAWDRLANYDQVLKALQPLVARANQPDASDEARTALAMQSTALLSLERFNEAIDAAEDFLRRPTEGPELAEALANICLARAHQQQWDAIDDPLGRLEATENQPLVDRVNYEIAETAYEAGEWEIAAAHYRQIVDRGAGRELYRPAVSGLAYTLHEHGRALNQQVTLAEERGESDVALLTRTIGTFDEAARWFSQLARMADEKQEPIVASDALYMTGLSLRLARRLPAATKTFMQVADQFGLPADGAKADEATTKAAYNAYRSAKEAARAYQELHQIEQADEAYQVAFDQLTRQPADKQEGLGALAYEWALMHYNSGDTARANELFVQFVKLDPQNQWADDAQLLLAESRYFDKDYEAARTAFRELISEPTTDDWVRERALVFLVDIGSRLEDWKDVAQNADTLIETFPEGKNLAEAQYRRGEAALRLDDLEKAKSVFSELAARVDEPSLAAQEWYPGVWLMLAETNFRLKEYDEVRRVASEFAELHPDSPLAYHLDVVVGRSDLKQARFDEARQAFARVIDSPHGKGTETAAKAQLFIAESYLTQRQYEKAFEEYYRVLLYGFPQWQSAALYQAGQCEEMLKRWEGAAKSYRQLLDEFPDSDKAGEARQRLEQLEQRFPETLGK